MKRILELTQLKMKVKKLVLSSFTGVNRFIQHSQRLQKKNDKVCLGPGITTLYIYYRITVSITNPSNIKGVRYCIPYL